MENRLFYAAALAVLLLGLSGCSKEKQPQPEPEIEVVDLIIDTDLGNSTDDLFALHAAFACQRREWCKVIGVMQSRKLEKAKDFLDRMMHFYKADDVPIGLIEGEQQFFEIIPYYQLVDSLKSNGQPLFEPTGIPLSDRLPAWKLYRKLLSEADDNSIYICCIGMFSNLGLLLDSPADEYSPLNGIELVRKKVKNLSLMGGCFNPVPLRYTDDAGSVRFLEVEYNVLGDIPLAKKVVECWPGDIDIFPVEEGMRYPSQHDKILSKYAWQPDSPIFQVYSHYDEWAKGDVGQYMWDLMTVLHSILGEEYFSCSPIGRILIDDKGVTDFVQSEDGNAHIIGTSPFKHTYMWELSDKLSLFHP